MKSTNEPYHIDKNLLKTWERDNEQVLNAGNRLLSVYSEITKFNITSWQEFLQMADNPEEFYKEQFFRANQKDFAGLSKLNLDFKKMIESPEGFSNVEMQAKTFLKKIEGRQENFTFADGKVKPSEKSISRINSKAIHIATTPAEKARLKICLQMIEAFGEILKELENSLDKHQFEQVKKTLSYARPLPFILKITGENKLIPNPGYVRSGFAGTAHLGFEIFTERQRELAEKSAKPNMGKPWVKFEKIMPDHTRKVFLIEQGKFQREYEGRPGINLLPGLWNENEMPFGQPITLTESIKSFDKLYQ